MTRTHSPRTRLLVLAAVAVALVASACGGPTSTAVVEQAATETAPVAVTGGHLDAFLSDGEDRSVGTAGPVLSGSTPDGSAIVVNGPDDPRPTLLVFGAHWCPHCQREFPALAEWASINNYFSSDLRIVAIPTATTPTRPNYPPSAWLESINWAGEILVDDEVSTAALSYGVTVFPFLVLLDGDGTVLARYAGTGIDFDAFTAAVR